MTTFTIPGPARGKARPVVFRNRHAVSPDPGWFQYNVRKAAQEAGLTPKDGPVCVTVSVTKMISQSTSKKRRASMLGRRCATIPDAANVEAAVHDALEGIAYQNDRQIAESHFHRHWGEQDQTVVTVFYLEEV